MTNKEGIKTTEFWLTLATFLLNALVSYGVFTKEESNSIEVALPVLLNVALVIFYAMSRAYVKAQQNR
jgi:hypothetical protein